MARIRVITSVAGVDFSCLPGEELDVPEAQAASWCEHGIAVRIDEPKPAAKKAPVKRAPRKPKPE